MSMNKYKMQEGRFLVEIEKPTKEQVESYWLANNEFKSMDASNDPKVFKKATIKHTFSEEKYPIDSVWMMGESPGIIINFFGEKLTMIQEKDLHAQI